MKNVLIGGVPRSGKSTLANLLLRHHGFSVLRGDRIMSALVRTHPEINIAPKPTCHEQTVDERTPYLLALFRKLTWHDGIPYVLESVLFYPETILAKAEDLLQRCTVVFVGYPNTDQQTKLQQILAYAQTDHQCVSHEIKGRELEQWIKTWIRESREIQRLSQTWISVCRHESGIRKVVAVCSGEDSRREFQPRGRCPAARLTVCSPLALCERKYRRQDMVNQWQKMNSEDAVAYDVRKESGIHAAKIVISREILWSFIQPYLPTDKSESILDVGGGTGIWTIRLAQAGYHIVLSDISPALLDRARMNIKEANLAHLIKVYQDDICDLRRYKDSSFALVLAIGAPLSYCVNAQEALSEIHRVTKASGFLVGDVENRFYGVHDSRRAKSWEDAKRILLEGIAYWPNADPPYPISEFSPSQLKEFLERTHWHMEKLYPTNLMETLLPGHVFDSVLKKENGIKEIVDLEMRLREDTSLGGCGFDLQFAAKKI